MKRTTLLLILTLTLLNGKLIANDPQGSLSANGPLCGSGTGTLTWTATAHNGPLTIVYKENGGTDRTAYNVNSGTPFNAYTNPVTSTTVYTIVSVTNNGNGDVRTSGFDGGSATITVDPLPSAGLTVSGSSTLCSGSGTNISVALSETGVNYQLRKSAGNVSVGPAVAGDGATIDLPTGSLSSTTTFNILATNTTTNCSVQLSGGAVATINPLPQGSLTANGPFCGSGAGKLTWTSTAGTGPFTIVYNDGVSERTKTGVVSSSPFDVFTTPVTTSTTYTLVSVTDETTTCARSGSFTIGSVTITINPVPSNSLTIGGGATLCSGPGTNITIALSESGVNYQLRNNIDNSSINVPVAGTTGTINLPTGNLSATTTFNILATSQVSTCAVQLTGTVVVNINPLPQGSLSANGPFCNTGTGKLTWTATAGTGPYTIVYNDGSGNRTKSGVISGSPFDVFTNPVTSNTTYTLVSVTDGSSCTRISGFTGSSSTITVNPLPVVTFITEPGPGPVCVDDQVTYTTQSGMSAYSWNLPGTLNVDYIITSGGTGTDNTVKLKYLSGGSKTVRVNYNNSAGCTAASPAVSVATTVNTLPNVNLVVGGGTSICAGTGTNITVALSESGVNYQLRNNAGNININTPVAGTSGSINLPTGILSATTTFNILASNATTGCSEQLIGTATVTVYPLPLVTTSSAASVCNGQSPNISLTASTPSSFTWTVGTITGGITGASGGSGSTINQILNNSDATARSVEYLVTPTSTLGSCTGPVYPITVTVNPSPTLTLVSQEARVCDGSQATVSLVGLLPGTTFTVFYNINGIARTPISNVGPSDDSGVASFTSAALIAANNGKYLRVTGITTTSSSPNCSMTFTFDAPMSVDPATVAGAASLPQDICYGTTPADLNLSGNTGNVVKWQKSLDIGFSSPSNISVTTTTLPGVSIGNLYTNTYFRAVVQSGVCTLGNATPVLVTVKPLPTPTITGPTPVNVASAGNIYNTEAGKTSYTWAVSGTGNSITGGTGTDAITVAWNTPGDQTVTLNYLANGCAAATPVSKTVHVNARPVAGNVTILGDPRSGLTLNTFYNYTDADSDTEGASTFQWYTGTDAGGSGLAAIPSATLRSYKLKDSDTTKYIGFSVTPLALTGANPGVQATTIVWVGPVINSAPAASSVAISGSKNVGGVLTGHYTYSDMENDLEFQSLFQWYSSTSSTGVFTPIPGEIYNTHLIDNDEQGRYFQFHVIPKAAFGRTTGIEVVSAVYGPANSRPFADNVLVTGNATIGSLLTGSYNYHDVDGDVQGTTTFRWLKTGSGGTTPISGATGTAYTLTGADEGFTIAFEVIPIALSGFPLAGIAVSSALTGPVLDPSLTVPVADQVCISGIRKANEVIIGKYNYTFYKSEGTSVYRWLKNGIPISGATGTQYTLTQADIDGGQDIAFEVTPESSNFIPKVGATVTSYPLARIKLIQTTYSLADTAFVLVPNVSGGVFSGKGVSNGYFSPWNADTASKPPHTVSYLLNIVNPLTTCSQQATVKISVVAVNAFMVGLNNVYCFDGKPDTIFVENVPPQGTNRTFHCTNPNSIIRVLHNDTVIIDPGKKRPGIAKDTLTYSYIFNGSYFPITQTYVTDSVGVALINGLNNGDVFCNNGAVKPIFPSLVGAAEVFTGPVTQNEAKNYFLDPSKGLGNTSVTFRHTHATGCFSEIMVPIIINPAPIVAFKPLAVCVASSTDSTKFLNKTTSVDSISGTGWDWKFFDGGLTWPNTSKHPSHLFKLGGDHKVTLTATTIKNCSATKDTTIGIGFKPVANFYWKNECYHTPKDSIVLHDTTFSTATILSRTWKFGLPAVVIKTAGFDTLLTTSFIKADTGNLMVTYKVSTGYKNCDDSVTRSIYIRPTIPLLTADYFQNFDNGRGGWIKQDETDQTWSFGRPDRKIINQAAPGGMNAWFTNFDTLNQKAVSSSIISPCFDFTTIQRPMISMELFKRFDNNRDGAALQYKIGDSKNWVLVGSEDDGINWYNSTVIRGKPGGDQQIGWTSVTSKDVAWAESRHTLDELSGKKDVKFRIAYGSDGNAVGNEGIAFDDIRIGARSRKVLLEHFTNLTNNASSNSNTTVTGLAKRMSSDVINIQYHTNFPGADPYFNDNPADASARILFYGLSKAPYSMVDGGNRINFANIYDYGTIPFDSLDLIRRSMVSPTFGISLTSSVSGNIVTVSGQIKALGPVTAENVTLHLVVTEKQNRKNKGVLPGDTVYYNVFRKLIPDAAGISLKKSWTKDETYTLTDRSWAVEKISNTGNIEVIAFIQNNSTKEIYQSQSVLKNIVVGVDNLNLSRSNGFSFYPNPTSNRLTIEFEKTLQSVTEIVIYDYKGTAVKTFRAGSGQEEYTIDNLGLPNGIYLVRVKSEGSDWGYKKLIIALK